MAFITWSEWNTRSQHQDYAHVFLFTKFCWFVKNSGSPYTEYRKCQERYEKMLVALYFIKNLRNAFVKTKPIPSSFKIRRLSSRDSAVVETSKNNRNLNGSHATWKDHRRISCLEGKRAEGPAQDPSHRETISLFINSPSEIKYAIRDAETNAFD